MDIIQLQHHLTPTSSDKSLRNEYGSSQLSQAGSFPLREYSASRSSLNIQPQRSRESDAVQNEEPTSSAQEIAPSDSLGISKVRAITVIATLAGINFLNTMGSGILIAALPRIAADVGLSDSLILWPAAVYALAAGCLLIIFGSIADIVGAKLMWISGSFLFCAFTVGLGCATTATQVILFRTLAGASISMCLPTAVSLITNTFPRGKWRNVAFAMNGMGSPLGYAVGLVLGGIFTDTIGWRWSYYMMAVINFCFSMASIWSAPTVHHPSEKRWTRRLVEDIDWVGAIILSVALGILLFVLAMTTQSYRSITDAQNIALLVVSVLLLASFPFWMRFQEKRGKPALIPNRLWRNAAFTSLCVSVFFGWASLNGIEYFTTLYFQQVQGVSALQSSLRFIPHVVMGVCTNVAMTYLVSRVRAQTLAVVSALITITAPIAMATTKIDEEYWLAPFWAMLLSPVNADVLFTVSNIVISDAFPAEIQSLAGAVFNEISQFGNSVGLSVTAAIAASITARSNDSDEKEAIMQGYRAAFWTIFSSAVVVVFVVFYGLRKGGTVGKKND